ncbi:MAG TPA: nicotinate-nucleotide adenylyltransferase [Candidatus Dormibacteraeota bacterium]|nr:nicotinate-nucleotide adenylyltransferase [Candidatus Dormibacteraeota bacterium]
MRVGILGGTFDPIHAGHLAAAYAAMECEGLGRVIFVPTGIPPHRAAAVASAGDRVAMARLAIAGEPRFEVSDIEVRRDGASFTVDTLRELKRVGSDDELFLILGWDAGKLFHTWHEPAEILKLAHVVVVTRPGSPPPTGRAMEAAGLGKGLATVCARETPDISGSALRRAIGASGAVGDRLPEGVRRYIDDHGLYMDNR